LLLLWTLWFSLRSAHEQMETYKRRTSALDDYERQIRLLRDEVSYLSEEKAVLQERYTLTRTNTNPECSHTDTTDASSCFCFHLSGWWEVALRAPCPGSAARPALWGASRPPEPSSLTPLATRASYRALVTCTPWSAWRPSLCFDATLLTWRWSRKSSSLLSWYDCSYCSVACLFFGAEVFGDSSVGLRRSV